MIGRYKIMQSINFGDKLQILRREKGLSQKEFAEYLGIPQPSMSAYENGRNSPTMEVLMGIAQKCNVSLDWLCGISGSRNSISSLADVADFFYALCELNEINGEIEIHDRLFNSLETETEKWYTRITFYGGDKQHPHNADFCNMLRIVRDNYYDLETYGMTKDIYDLAKQRTKEYYSGVPLTKKEFPELSRYEFMKKRAEYINSAYLDDLKEAHDDAET